MKKILEIYQIIFKVVPSKKKYFLILFSFIFISLLDLVSISTLAILLSKILKVDQQVLLSSSFLNFSELETLFLLVIFIFIKQIVYIYVFYIFLNYSYSLKNLFIYKFIDTSFLNKKITDKKEEQLNFIRIIEEFTNSSLIPSFMFIFELVVISTISIYVFFWDPKSASIILIFFLFLGFFYFKFIPKIIRNLGENNINLNQDIIKTINYVNEGIRELLSFQKESNILLPLKTTLSTLKKQLVKYDLINAMPRVSFEVLLILALSIVFIINNEKSNLFLLNSSIFIFAFTKLIPSMIKFMNILNSLNYGKYSLKKILELDCRYNDSLAFQEKLNLNSTKNFEKIFFQDLSISFLNDVNQTLTINYPNFEILKNQKVLISSKSGKGKSTFLDIFAGYKSPETGSISAMNDGKLSELNRDIICYSPQFNFLLDENIIKNIKLSFEDQSEDDLKEKIYEDFLSENKNLFNSKTVLNASGGEKKRIGILRAFYNFNKSKKILIFDEPTASLDEKNKIIFYDWINSLKDTTVIIASHDKNTEKFYDKIISF